MLKLIKLYPHFLLIPIVGALVLLFVAARMVAAGVSFVVAALVLIIGFAILCILGMSYAVNANQNKLCWLYQDLEPERFVVMYEKLLPRAKKDPDLEVNLRAHMANGYAAYGEFEKALAVMDAAPEIPDEELNRTAKILLLNNRAQIYFQLEQAEKGKECMDQMRVLLSQSSEALQKQYEENLRMMRCHYEALTGVCRDDAYLREVVRNSTTNLFRVNASLLLARVYLSQGETEMARSYLEQTYEKGRDWLWPTQKAVEMMKALPPAAN